MKAKIKATWVSVFLLIAIEQTIKIIIYNNFFDKRFAILPPILYFEPMFNRHYSWFNSMLKLNAGKGLHIAVVVILSILVIVFYRFLTKRIGSIKIVNIMFAFLFSGAMCSLIDKVFWDGSLDYIMLKGFFTFDLKDLYIDVFIGLMILLLFTKNEQLKQIDEKVLLKDFLDCLLNKKHY
ncbi:signal peptidase II [Pseudobacteroides cellulosolvens]|uniref:Peptidase A8 signal peptidase II n=1 Tax=Pseudobacteroides cellulosolvens ATCC 35603 = DSM 2933 TaxID=398512 RepID=A0A0L6JRJ2_9FIRM|nr:signal peptidase II [Pseudobacteroides cellulosolvens]KNY28300.1 peptidase A8 signal peptidase II [Pseudobacteroides cellulosolvens ATCC 35603 = DSM 2933]